MTKRILKVVIIIICALIFLLVGLIVFLSITEYRPDSVQTAERIVSDGGAAAGSTLTICSWNIGYGGLGEESDFFMDGGEMVDPPSQEIVEKNLQGIQCFMQSEPSDIWLLQEVDVNSSRTNGIDELKQLAELKNSAFAYNYKCPFVPIPMPPMGRVESGIATLSDIKTDGQAQRVSLPCPFSWPVSAANLKRCLLVERMEVEGSDKELVVINLHLEAYEDGAGRIAQTKQLIELMENEYAKGNYVIAGGDFNQTFPGALDVYPIADAEKWTPGILEESSLPDRWQFVYDMSSPTCRLLDQPYCEDCQLYVIDGFIVSPNVRPDAVETVQLDFEYSDHNPVRMSVTLQP